MLTLNLIRHAKTDQISVTGRDFDRELLPKGIIQANMLGVYLQQRQIVPGQIICSSAQRTRQTCKILEQHLFPEKAITFHQTLYLANYPNILDLIQEQTFPTITVIGHNEGISELASYLSGGLHHLKTCGFIQLQSTAQNWQELIRDSMSVSDQYRPEVYFP